MKKVRERNENVEVIVANSGNIKEYFEVLSNKMDKLLSKNQPSPDLGDFIFMDEVCSLTNLKKNSIYMLTCHNKIPFIKPAGTKKLMFSRTAVIEWLQTDKTNRTNRWK